MTRPVRPWVTAGLPTGAYEALAQGLPASRLRSLLLEVAEARAARRALPELMAQWDRDRFVQPAILDQRTLVEVDRHLLAATSAFESIELSPVARWASVPRWGIRARTRCYRRSAGPKWYPIRPACWRIECARRLRRNAATTVRRATSHRCVRAQEIPKRRGLTANFRIFCLASAGLERQNHAFVVEAVVEHMTSMLDTLDRLEQHGFAFPDRRITVLAIEQYSALGDRIVAMLGRPAARAVLEHSYYNRGLRFQMSARTNDGTETPLVDGGAFDWLAKLTSNRKAVYVASGLGSQLVPLMFRRR